MTWHKGIFLLQSDTQTGVGPKESMVDRNRAKQGAQWKLKDTLMAQKSRHMSAYEHIHIWVDICTCIVIYIMRMFFFLCVQRLHAMVHWPKIQSNVSVRAFNQFVPHKVDLSQETNLWNCRDNVAMMNCKSPIDLLCIAHNLTPKLSDCVPGRVFLRHI